MVKLYTVLVRVNDKPRPAFYVKAISEEIARIIVGDILQDIKDQNLEIHVSLHL